MKEHENDISIGNGQWILYEDTTYDRGHSIDLDDYMTSLMPMWKSLESLCVAECCGIDAFSLRSEDIVKNTRHLDQKQILENLVILKVKVEDFKFNILDSYYLNTLFTKNVFLQLIEHLISTYENA